MLGAVLVGEDGVAARLLGDNGAQDLVGEDSS